jgi:hypothetical protein
MAGSIRVGRQEIMRATSVMRFVIFGAIGFGIGLAIAGFFNSGFIAITAPIPPPGRGAEPPPWWLSQMPSLSWFFAGACGGAGLGLALKSWKRVAALALAGAVGFGVGNLFFFALAFLFGFPLVGAGMGALGGLILGLALADWRKVLLLGLVGMVGFGVGEAFSAALGMSVLGIDWEQPPLLLFVYVLVMGMVGIIGGASLGAALGFLENRKLAQGQRPRVR